ncbi:MAG: aminotransferase class V-fold PLP-dependent enzyme [Erysipelotrichaceae bacterium]|nr:aminotransferase class V-fold PLP-dependent enzyme [Erysipelotrichaceae bacterium]
MIDVRKRFPMLNNHHGLIYFDNAATTFKPDTVIKRVEDFYCFKTTNIHRGDYDLSFQLSNEYEKTRSLVAEFLNAEKNKEIVFTSGASEALNLVAYGYGQKFLKAGDIILTSEAEHASNILPWFKVAELTKARIEYVELDEFGRFNLESFKNKLSNKVKVVTLAHVSNVLGYILPMKEIVSLAHEVGAIVVCDGAQSVPHIKYDVQALDVDFVAFSAHKMYGPSGVGCLYGKYDLLEKMDPFMLGGGSNARFDICGNILLKQAPYKFETGTPNIEGILGLGGAIEFINEVGIENIEAYERDLARYFMDKMLALDNVTVYNPSADCPLIAFNIKGVFAQDAATYLNKQHICVRSGNHCAKVLIEVIKVGETLRASLAIYNTKAEIDAFVNIVKGITLEKTIEAIL